MAKGAPNPGQDACRPSPTLRTLPAGGDVEEDDAASSTVSSPEAFSSISSEIPAAGDEDGVEVEPRKGGCEDGEEEEAEEEEDLICRRTRARYSLANFTLDELETFLQETDDEEFFQKADEEYQKFLAGVLAGEGEYDAAGKEAEDENEDENDADFEVELEELLESDHEEVGKATMLAPRGSVVAIAGVRIHGRIAAGEPWGCRGKSLRPGRDSAQTDSTILGAGAIVDIRHCPTDRGEQFHSAPDWAAPLFDPRACPALDSGLHALHIRALQAVCR